MQSRIVQEVPEKIEKNKQTNKYHHDKTARKLPELKIGQPVMVQLQPKNSKIWTKGKILTKLNESSYIVHSKGNNYRTNIVNIRQHVKSDQSDREAFNREDKTKEANRPEITYTEKEANKEKQNITDDISNTTERCNEPDSETNTPTNNIKPKPIPIPKGSRVQSAAKDKVDRPTSNRKMPEKYKDYEINK